MKLKNILLSMLFVLTTAVCVLAQNPKREVVFTLGANEEIYMGEYFATQYFNQNKIACIVTDTEEGDKTFVFNGKKVQKAVSIRVDYLDVNEENGYIFSFSEDDKMHLNFKGKVYKNVVEYNFDANYENFRCITNEGDNYYIYREKIKEGPFDYIKFNHGNYLNPSFEGDYDYCYLLAGRWWGHKNGEDERIQKIPPHFFYQNNGKWYVYINNKLESISDDIRLNYSDYYSTTPNVKYAYKYKNNGKWYAYIDGKRSEGYDEIGELISTKSRIYAYQYKVNGKWNVNINGRDLYTRYDMIYWIRLTESGEYAFAYENQDKKYVNINGKSSPAGSDLRDLEFISSKKYAYIYYDYYNDKKYFVNINGETSQGYDKIDNFKFTKNGEYAYQYKDNGKYYVNINGKPSPGYEEAVPWTFLKFNSSEEYAYSYKDNEKWYVIINGKPSQGYDEVYFNSFRFTSNGEYAYQYKDNGKMYVNMNGKPSPGYDEIFSFSFSGNEKYSYRYKSNGKWHANVNGALSPGYDEIREYSENWKIYKENGKWYVNNNGILSPGYDNLDEYSGDNKYKENGKWYININGKKQGGYDYIFYYNTDDESCRYFRQGTCYEKNDNKEKIRYFDTWLNYGDDYRDDIGNIEFYSADKKHLFYSGYQYEYITINNKRHGAAPAIRAWYDEKKNAFIWNAVEGKELVVYEYKLD